MNPLLQLPRNNSNHGFTIIELLISIAMGALILAAVATLFDQVLLTGDNIEQQNDGMQDARFAMQRMSAAVLGTDQLFLPTADNPNTTTHPSNPARNWLENIREQTVPATVGLAYESAVLAVSLSKDIDTDQDGFADADNDRDGRIDEDPSADLSDDGAAGILGIDDDGDGSIDEGNFSDDDESGQSWEDPVNGMDDDGDGQIDEDSDDDINQDGEPGIAGVDDDADGTVDEGFAEDDDEDGQGDEDWPDTVVFFLQGSTLIERHPNVPASSGLDFVENPIAENVVRFRVERVPQGSGRSVLVDVTLELSSSNGNISLHSRLRVGGET